MAAADNDLGPEAVEAVRQAAERAAEWPSRDRLDALARSLDVLARHEAERREALAIVRRVADMDGMICTCVHNKHADQHCIVAQARALLDREAAQ